MYNANTGTEANLILVAPEVANLAAGTQRLRFFAKCSSGTQSVQFGTINTITENGEFTLIQTITITAAYAEYTIDYAGYVGTNNFIAVRHNGAQYSSIYLDDMRWEAIPICADVSQVQVPIENITANTATVNWTANGTETSHMGQVYLSLQLTDKI